MASRGGIGGSSSTQENIRKVLNAIKDSTKLVLSQINSDYKELDMAIVKATNHVECVPKEKYVRIIFEATAVSRPRADVAYCIQTLARRVAKTHNWTVALKTLMVIHRTLRDGDRTFTEELMHFSQSRRLAFNLSNFKDDSSPSTWNYSAFIRAYALYLEERLECSRTLGYDIESDHLLKMKQLDTIDLLHQLPALQQLLYRAMGCQPEGASYSNHVIQCALNLVLKESVRIYQAISDGMINLVDKFFEMQRIDASKALEIYRRNGQQTEKLSDFYDICKGLDFSKNLKYPELEQPPQSFLSSMEQYVRDAPRQSPFVRRYSVEDRDNYVARKPGPILALEFGKQIEREEPTIPPPVQADKSVSPPVSPVATLSSANVDLLELDDEKDDVDTLEESNALALAIVPVSSGTTSVVSDTNPGVTSWELALVTSSNDSAISQRKLAGGFDHLTLDSLYEDALSRRAHSSVPNGMNQMVPYPFQPPIVQRDPFFASANVAPPPSVQLSALAQQQQAMMMQQQHYFQQSTMMQQQYHQQLFNQSMMIQQQYRHMLNGSRQQPVDSFASYGMPNYTMTQPGSNPQMQSNPFANPNVM